MIVKSENPENLTSHAVNHGCCGNETAAEAHGEGANDTHHAQVAPTKAAPSSCCSSNGKEDKPSVTKFDKGAANRR